MRIRLTNPVKANHPDLKEILFDLAQAVHSHDPDLRTRCLYVEVSANHQGRFSGAAFPRTWSWGRWDRYTYNRHENGKVSLSICREISEVGLVRLFCHELRHIAQFHRGKEQHGYLTIAPMRARESEDDAYEFEDHMVARLI